MLRDNGQIYHLSIKYLRSCAGTKQSVDIHTSELKYLDGLQRKGPHRKKYLDYAKKYMSAI